MADFQFSVPQAPASDIDLLIEYFENVYPNKKADLMEQINLCRQFKDKHDVTLLGYSSLAFKLEIDEWLNFAGQILDQNKGDQLNIAHDERSEEKRRASADVVKAQAANLIAPITRAYKELKDMQDTLSKTISFSQTQIRTTTESEYGEIFSNQNEAPAEIYSAPNPAKALQRNRKHN